jgi:hypothetical protein
LHPGQSQQGVSARTRRSSLGLTRMRSNKGELIFMTTDYAERKAPAASLTNAFRSFRRTR